MKLINIGSPIQNGDEAFGAKKKWPPWFARVTTEIE